MRRAGFSLLEVILAVAILAGAVAVLGELARLGIRNARIARDMTEAQLRCESLLAEISAGIALPEPIAGAPFAIDDPNATPGWLYTIELATIDQEGLMAVRVTVHQDLPKRKRPVRFALTRWILDPGIEPSEVPELEEGEEGSREEGDGESGSGESGSGEEGGIREIG